MDSSAREGGGEQLCRHGGNLSGARKESLLGLEERGDKHNKGRNDQPEWSPGGRPARESAGGGKEANTKGRETVSPSGALERGLLVSLLRGKKGQIQEGSERWRYGQPEGRPTREL